MSDKEEFTEESLKAFYRQVKAGGSMYHYEDFMGTYMETDVGPSVGSPLADWSVWFKMDKEV